MFIISVLRKEAAYFLQETPGNLRRLFASNIFQTIASPLIALFISAFIWRATHSFVNIAAYNVGRYAFHPITFYFNGMLLRRFTVRTMFALGAVLAGLSTLIIVMFQTTNAWAYLGYGSIYGIGYGFYWANRNYLELKETLAEGRKYYFSIMQIASNLSSISMPFLAGWFIVLGSYNGWYGTTEAYWVLFAISFILLAIAGYIVYLGSFESPAPTVLTRFNQRPVWNNRRLLSMSAGTIDGLSFIPTLLVLSLLGDEGVLGTITAIVALLIVVATYLYGRKVDQKNQYKILVASSVLLFIGSFVLALFPGQAALVFIVVTSGIGSVFFLLAFNPISFLLTDAETAGDASVRYSFIIDNEIFLNVGRLIALAAGIFMFFYFSENAVLIYGPIVAACFQLLFLGIFFAKTANR